MVAWYTSDIRDFETTKKREDNWSRKGRTLYQVSPGTGARIPHAYPPRSSRWHFFYKGKRPLHPEKNSFSSTVSLFASFPFFVVAELRVHRYCCLRNRRKEFITFLSFLALCTVFCFLCCLFCFARPD